MEYESNFVKSFMRRTLVLAESYSGTYDATLLVNCLLGLLIVPKEALFQSIPETPYESILDWGIHASSIKSVGRCEYGHLHPPNLRQIVRRMRNAIAHFKVEPFQKDGEVLGFTFRDKNGFHAQVSLVELQSFVVKLARHLEGAA